MSKEHRICVDRREFPREQTSEPTPDDTPFVWAMGVIIAVTVVLWACWLVWVLLP